MNGVKDNEKKKTVILNLEKGKRKGKQLHATIMFNKVTTIPNPISHILMHIYYIRIYIQFTSIIQSLITYNVGTRWKVLKLPSLPSILITGYLKTCRQEKYCKLGNIIFLYKIE